MDGACLVREQEARIASYLVAPKVTLTDIVAVGGIISGVAGLVLGVMNFVRDRVKLDITLQWDMDITHGTQYDTSEKWGVVRVQNTGRRTTFVSHVAIKIPKGYDGTHLLVMDSVAGEKLAEGDAPKIYVLTQEGLERYRKDWHKLIAVVSDSTGQVWKSRRVSRKKCPSWAAE